MLIKFFNASMLSRLLSASLLAFSFSFLPVGARAEWGNDDRHDLASIINLVSSISGDTEFMVEDVDSIANNTSLLYDVFWTRFYPLYVQNSITNAVIGRRLLELERAILPMRDYHGNWVLNESGLQNSGNLLYNSWRTMNQITNKLPVMRNDLSYLREGFFGHGYTNTPFRVYHINGIPIPSEASANNSLAGFLSLTLGQNYLNGARSLPWEHRFNETNTLRWTQSNGSSGWTADSFNFWLAEGIRRQVNLLTNSLVVAEQSFLADTNFYVAVTGGLFRANFATNGVPEYFNLITNEISVANVSNDLAFTELLETTNEVTAVEPGDSDYDPSEDYDETDTGNDATDSLLSILDRPSVTGNFIIPFLDRETIDGLISVSGITGPVSIPLANYNLQYNDSSGKILETSEQVGNLMSYVYFFIGSVSKLICALQFYLRARSLVLNQSISVPNMKGL